MPDETVEPTEHTSPPEVDASEATELATDTDTAAEAEPSAEVETAEAAEEPAAEVETAEAAEAEPSAEVETAEAAEEPAAEVETAEAAEEPAAEVETAEAAEPAAAASAEPAAEPVADAEEDPDAEPAEPEIVVEREGMGWYVVHTYSGYENKAKLALLDRMKTLDYEDYFGDILVPEEQVVERTRTGKTRNVSKRFYPGYMLVQMDLTNETWHVVKDTPKVTGFVGGNNRKPSQVPPHEVARILGQISKESVESKPKIQFDKGESIRVVDGPFANFNGVVDEVRPDKGKLRVLVSIFGRSTPVELDYIQVEKD
jgi:transcriptional antiterminator NusG